MGTSRWMLAGVLWLTGCGDPEPVRYTADQAYVCYNTVSQGYQLVFDTGCLSSTCDPIEKLTCDTRRDGGALVVEAELYVGQPQKTDCTDDCGQALCPLAVDDSVAAVRHGEHILPVDTIPDCEM